MGTNAGESSHSLPKFWMHLDLSRMIFERIHSELRAYLIRISLLAAR